MAEQAQKPVVRFGVFEANLPSGELRKHGLLIRVPGQPFKILAIFLERPGEVVTRDELRRSLWSAETFVDFEHSLNSAIKKLREALGDSADNPRYIETLPRVGYRFIAPVSSGGPEATVESAKAVEPAPQPASAPAVPHPRYRLAHLRLLVIAFVILTVGGGVWFAVRHAKPLITEQDSIVLADFENRTGDPAFDGTLKKVLEVEISQSPYLNILPDQDVRQTLEYMRRRPEEPITKQVGLEICQRNSAKAVVNGSIASLGNRYVLTLEALNCTTGGVLAEAEAEAESKERVLRALDDSAGKIRAKLGESRDSIRKFGAPVEEVTTGSLDALKMFALGDELRRQGKVAESIPFFKQASEIDPQFTLAYGRLGAAYANLSESSLAKEYLGKAFQLRERTSERERLYLAARYYENVSGEAGKTIDNYEIWRTAYPRDWIPFNNLGNKYTDLGQYEKAIEVSKEAVRLNPNHEFPYETIARAYKRANRYAEAKSIADAAIAKHLERWGIHGILYQIAFAERAAGTMQRQAEWGIGKSTEDETLMYEASAAATAGRLRDSRELFRRSFAAARKNGFSDNAAAAVETQGSIEAAFHNFNEARERAAAALTLEGANVSDDAALILAQIGDLTRAESLADDLARRRPLDTLVNEVGVPRIRAEVAIRRGQPAHAVDLLRNAVPFELRDFTVPYIRGEAYLAAHMGTDAAREFQKIVKNQGVDPISPYYPLAHIGLAQAYALQGDSAASRREYEEFFALWKDADQDIPILREARGAYAQVAQRSRP
ncbi:MAG: winged helix-turn-helix domain-containing protein [Bryobacteraceae bacterium]|jgi:DNA-binding winged helix-turn-helix (wHTH) protein/tetratricopeptide (TPR) repeat protein